MIKPIIFLLFMLLILFLPICQWRSPRWYRFFMRILSRSPKGHKFLAYLLALVVCIFNLVYFAVFPHNKGIIISTLMMVFLLSVDKSVQVLKFVHERRRLTRCLVWFTWLIAYFKFLFPAAVVLAFFLEFAIILPSNEEIIEKTRKTRENQNIPKIRKRDNPSSGDDIVAVESHYEDGDCKESRSIIIPQPDSTGKS